jgi:hypothetical protein
LTDSGTGGPRYGFHTGVPGNLIAAGIPSLGSNDTFAIEVLPVVADSPFLDIVPEDRGMMHQELIADRRGRRTRRPRRGR